MTNATKRPKEKAEPPVLGDKDRFPTEEIIYSHIGKTKTLWEALFRFIHSTYPDFSEEWRYYNDGKSWLLKVTRKAKTICWVSILKNTFRTTFYFTEKAEPVIRHSALPQDLKKQFLTGRQFGKIRGLTVVYKTKSDLESAKALLSIKASIK